MKLVFTKLETPATEIKVAFDGVNYKSYNVDEIKSTGYIQFTEKECPDLTKVKIQGKFSTLGSVEVNKAVELERGEGGESGISCTFEKDVFEEREVTTTYYCFAFDNNNNGEITNDDNVPENWHIWLKDEISENAVPFTTNNPGIPKSALSLDFYRDTDIVLDESKTVLVNDWDVKNQNYVRYPDGDFIDDENANTYYCFAYDADNNGEIDEDEQYYYTHYWLKDEISENADVFRCNFNGMPETAEDFYQDSVKVWFKNRDKTIISIFYNYPYIRYPEGDISETRIEKVKVGTETVTEVITEIQEEPTITENGQTVAEEGKAFKSVIVHPGVEFYKYSFDCGSWDNEVYSTLNKPFLEEGDLVMSIDGCWGGISIWQLDSNEMKIPEFPKFIGLTSLAEIMRKNIAASNQPH